MRVAKEVEEEFNLVDFFIGPFGISVVILVLLLLRIVKRSDGERPSERRRGEHKERQRRDAEDCFGRGGRTVSGAGGSQSSAAQQFSRTSSAVL